MFAKIKLKYNDNKMPSPLPQRRMKSLLPRTLVISTAVVVLLLISITYHSIVLEHLDELKQFVRLSKDGKTSQSATEIEMEVESSQSIIQIPDSEMVTSDGNNIMNNDVLQSLNIEHGQIKLSHHRLSRDLDDGLDPLALQYQMNIEKLKSQVRDKRTRIALSQLENDYVRCKKDSKDDNDCMLEFVKLYKVAKDLSEKMEKMVEMFEDSELVLQQSLKSSETVSNEANKPETALDNADNLDNNKQNADHNITSLKVTAENPLQIGEKLTTLSLNSTMDIKIISTTTTPKPIKIKPLKISWIIDGNDDDIDEETSTHNSTTSALTAKISVDDTTTIAPARTENATNTKTADKSELIEEIVVSQELTTNSDETEYEIEIDNEDILLVKGDFVDLSDYHVTKTEQSRTSPTINASNISSTTSVPSSTIFSEQEKLRKLKFDLLVGKKNFSSQEEFSSGEKLTTTTIKNDNIQAWTTDIDSSNVAATKAIISTQNIVTDVPPNDNINEDLKLQDNFWTTTESHIQKITNSSERSQNMTHPLDYPTSLENMLESFERSDVLKPTAHLSNTHETDLYDPSLWIEKFQEAAAMHPQEGELLNIFDEKDVQNVSKLEPKLNPANMQSLSADDTQLLSLCERMAKRLRSKGGGLGSSNFTQTPAMQFTSRGPGGFPITGEAMKATAQFMYNPSFGMPSIPICFYLTPANFRMPSQVAMWPSPYFGNSNFYGGPSGGLMGSGIGPGAGAGAGSMYFMPPSFGGTGNFFIGTGTGNSQSNGQNIFPKTATAPKQQPQQFYCTYMQNNSNQGTSSNSGSSSNTLGSTSFSNGNFKLRTSNQTSPLDIVYASYVDVPAHLDRKAHLKCELPEHVACYGGNECIRESSWCDSLVDCSDGSDEAACTCQDRLSSDRICDGYPDCPMGEDEIGCYGCDSYMYSCYSNAAEYERFNRSTISMCYNILDRCDGIQNCLNGRDERECSILANDLTHHMSHSVSSSEGFLYHNHRGEWFPVCNNAEVWAKEACRDEGGYVNAPNVTFREIALPGPFIEPSQVGEAHFPHSCQKRNSAEALADHATYVKCALNKCGNRKKNTETSIRPKSKRLSKLQKRIIADNDENAETKSSERIVGGKYSKSLEWPFVVAIYRNGNFHCGGTIYNERWIISAAHCAINYPKYFYEVRAGLLRRSSYSASTQIQPVSHIVMHQGYHRLSMRNDLSLFRLAEPLRFNRWVKPICLPDIGRTTNGDDWIWGPEVNTLCTAVGWGAIREKGPGSDQLREVVIPIQKRCKDRPDQESESICAGDSHGGYDACQGDSGGPLFCRSVSNSDEWYLAGVVSHGNGCARLGEYGVYTRVALYLDWIEMAVRPEFLPKTQPMKSCPGYECVWGGKRCIPQRKRCDRIVNCLGGEDEVGCVYNFIPDVGSAQNSTTTESDYFPFDETTTQPILLQNTESSTETTISEPSSVLPTIIHSKMTPTTLLTTETTNTPTESSSIDTKSTSNAFGEENTSKIGTETSSKSSKVTTVTLPPTKASTSSSVTSTTVEALQDLTKTDNKQLQNSTANEVKISTPATEEMTTLMPSRKTSTKTTTVPKVKHTSTIPDKFVCQKIRQIVELKHRCDRIVDCEDGTDEENCNCRDYLKGTLDILVCDGKADCEDGSDEEDCGHCQPDEFRCPLSKLCIPLVKRCDNIGDCQFKEDETDCFALTNGNDVQQDLNKRPIFSNFGIFTRNINGTWRIVCAEETSFHAHSAKTAADVCSLLGFKGYKFYNTTTLISHYDIVMPIDPDMVKLPRIKTHLAAAVEDSFHFSSNENLFPIEMRKKSRTVNIETSKESCYGIYVECNAASNKTEPLKTLTAGNVLEPNLDDIQKLKPQVTTHVRPNVYVKPELPTQLVNKEEEALDKLNPAGETRPNMTILANNELHVAVEELHWPWLVDIYANGKLWCAGVLLDKYWVMVHESCYFGIRLNTDYISALFGGGKTKNIPHKNPLEQIRRIDCFQSVPRSDVILFHLERPVHFSHNVLPIFLPEQDISEDSTKRKCMAILHDELTGLIRTVQIIEHSEDDTCKMSQTACYRFMDNTELTNLTLEADNEHADQARHANMRENILSALSTSTTCSQFGHKTSRGTIEPIDQGILVCRDVNDGWFPAALFSYNNTDCRSFKRPFGIRTLEKLFTTLQTMIDQPKCSITHMEPLCETFRCPLGKCLASEEICNKKHDCHEGSDEDPMFCLEYKRGCESWEMQCRSSKKCIPKSKFCDHIPDCEDFTDEPTVCSCFTYLKATDPGKICDGIRNCWDKSDESPVLCNCTAKLFSCGINSRECIPQDFVCDKEPDCPNGEDERYCFGIEQPQLNPTHKNDHDHVDPVRPPKYGQVIEQSYGVWHTKCFPRSSPPDISEVRQICKKLGYTPYRQPSYRLIDDAANEVVETNEPEPDMRGRSFENTTIAEKYRSSTKAVVVSKFSPIKLNNELTLLLKPSRPIAELVRWNATDSTRCFRLEIRCI